MAGQDDLVASLQAIMAARGEQLGEPPTPEELLAYRDGRLGEEERQAIADKLVLYPDAARTLADLAAFPDVEPAPGTPELSAEEIGARWQTFRRRLADRPPPRAAPISVTFWRRPAWQLAAAALLGLAIGWAAGFAARAWRDSSGAAVNVQIAELSPADGEGARSAIKPVTLGEGSEELLLVLGAATREEPTFQDYEAEVSDALGRRVWSRGGLRPTELGTFQLAFRRGALAPGRYRIDLFGRSPGGKILVGSYTLWLLHAAAPQ